MQQIFANTSKVYIDTKAGSNLLSLPLDRLMQSGASDAGARAVGAMQSTQSDTAAPAPSAPPAVNRQDAIRGRERETR
jgi:membrane protease subunit HflK